MTIPEIRAEMLKEAALCQDLVFRALLLKWESELHRRRVVRKAPCRSRGMTEDLVKAIRECAAANPQLSQQKISERFRVTAGRVSESLRGKRT